MGQRAGAVRQRNRRNVVKLRGRTKDTTPIPRVRWAARVMRLMARLTHSGVVGQAGETAWVGRGAAADQTPTLLRTDARGVEWEPPRYGVVASWPVSVQRGHNTQISITVIVMSAMEWTTCAPSRTIEAIQLHHRTTLRRGQRWRGHRRRGHR
jgi:hypothetical protein